MIDPNQISLFESDLLGERYYRYCHESGLPVFVFPKKMTSTYALFAADFGSVDHAFDAAGREQMPEGVAHFLEHKLFSNEDGSDSFEHFSALGADANAYTSHTRTVYLFSCTSRFEESLEELIRFVTHPYFTPKTVKKEQGIIAEEIRMCRDNPYDRCYYNMLAGLYAAHPVRKDICGSVQSISSITDQVLYRAYHTFYQPSNMALVVCGDVEPRAVFSLVEEALASLPPTKKATPPRCSVVEAASAHRQYVKEAGQVAKPIFSIGIKDTELPADPRERARRDAGMAILNEILFSEAGELYNSLVDRGLISPELSFEYALTRDFAFNQIAGEAADPEQVLDEILAYLEEKKKSGLSREDFERCRRIEYAEYIKSFDSVEEIANTLLAFVFDNAELFDYAEIVREMELPFVEQLLHSVFDPAHFTLSVVTPRQQKSEVTV